VQTITSNAEHHIGNHPDDSPTVVVIPADAQHLIRPRRVRRAINTRQPGPGFLASLHETAALAHLPGEPSRYGITVAAARAVAAPAEVTNA